MEKNRLQILPKSLESTINPMLTVINNQLTKIDNKMVKLIEQCEEYQIKKYYLWRVCSYRLIVMP